MSHIRARSSSTHYQRTITFLHAYLLKITHHNLWHCAYKNIQCASIYRCALDSGVFRVALNFAGWVWRAAKDPPLFGGQGIYEIDDSVECVLNTKKINRIGYVYMCIMECYSFLIVSEMSSHCMTLPKGTRVVVKGLV